MRYKRLLPAIPFIAIFMILNVTVEMNVIAEYSIVTYVNRISYLVIWVLCFAFLIPRYNWKWLLLLGIKVYTVFYMAFFDDGIACNIMGDKASHAVYYGILIGSIAFLVAICVIYQFYCLIKADEKVKLKAA